jgi:hypothetical protein
VKWWAVVLVTCSGLSAADVRLYFSKSFPGSVPAFVAITVDPAGAGEFKDSPEDESPLKFQLGAAEASRMFSLADKLDHFTRPLESPFKVAQMGMKTFRFEQGDKKTEVKFNFSQDLNAQELTDWFERISETAQNYYALERAVRYDKLGVNQALLQFEIELDRKRVVAAEMFLPLLDRVAKNASFLNMARTRAANLAESIRAAK